MNQWTPEWDTRPPQPDPTNYDPAVPGPYTSPPPLDPFPHKPRRHGLYVALAALGGLGIFALWIGATTDPEVVDIPNSAVKPTYDPGLYTPEAHKPSPTGVPRDGTLIVGKDVRPGLYRSVVVPRYLAGREDNGYCYVSRLNTTTPQLGGVRTEYDHVPTGPIIADASYRETGELVALRVLPTDKAVEVDCGGAVWERVH